MQIDLLHRSNEEAEDLLGYTQPAFKKSKLLKDSKYKVPQSTFFKQYKSCAEDSSLKQVMQGWALINESKSEKEEAPSTSDLEGYDLVFAKIAFSVNKADFERYQMQW